MTPPGFAEIAPDRPAPRPPSRLEGLAFAHLVLFIVAATWGFGGNTDEMRDILTLWGALGAGLTLAAALGRRGGHRPDRSMIRSLWPLGVFNALVLISCLTPGFREVHSGPDILLVPRNVPAWRPVAALPGLSLRALALFDGIYLSCFNLLLFAQRRRRLRRLFLFAAANAVALAIFGTVQKLVGSKGLFFGLVPSPQIYFFASFIYHNHWGAFAVLMTAASLGLVTHFYRRKEGRDAFHSPVFAGLLGVFLIALTAPLSTSRSATVLIALLLGGAGLRTLFRFTRRRQRDGRSIAAPLGAALLLGLAALGAVVFLAGPTLEQRFDKTEQQLGDIRARGNIGSRGVLYRDTWRMARDRLWFGWGMASYPHVFVLYDTQESPRDQLPVFYRDAHNDWLQSLAEHGLVGSALLALCALLPLRRCRLRRLSERPLTFYLFVGCAIVLLYALVEFPFGNTAVVFFWWLCLFGGARNAQLAQAASS